MADNYLVVNGNIKPRCIPLGEKNAGVVEINQKREITDKERIDAIEDKISEITDTLDSLFIIIKGLRRKTNTIVDKEQNIPTKSVLDIPDGTILIGESKHKIHYCVVNNGMFYVNGNGYATLSGAAEAASGTRRSGLVFWKKDGLTVREVYRKNGPVC